MKYNKFLILLLCAAFALGGCKTKLGHERSHYFSEVESNFVEPISSYRPMPLWTWNSKITRDDIDRMLGDFKEHGFGGAFIHPRPGMETVYLSDDWFDLWEYSVKKGEELGLEIWIYDENSYPSGFAGGHVPYEWPESYNHPTGLRPKVVEQLPEDLSPYCLCLKQEGDKFIDITNAPRTDEKGRYFIYKEQFRPAKAWNAGFPYVDVLYKGLTEKFIEVTMRGYEARFGKDLAKKAHGVFTDEPQYQNWTPDMFNEFEKDWGYSLRTHLPMIKEEVGNWKEVRYKFTATKNRLFVERYPKVWYNYCDKKGLQYTGHYIEHPWPKMHKLADAMAMYEWHHMPGIDLLFNQYSDEDPNAHFGNVRIVKEVRSAANQVGQTRILCEAYGGAGWETTFEDFKRLGDWQYALGVNFMNQHYSNVTIEGTRKFDYPDFFTRYSPWANDYKLLNDHHARLSAVLSHGEQMNDILVLEPTSTIWMYYTHRYQHPRVMEIGQNFTTFITSLNKAQVEFDLGSETVVRNRGKIKGSKFVVGERAYSTVIIPEMCENLFPSTAALLAEFAENGGKIIALSTPTLEDACPSEILTNLWARTEIVREVKIEELGNDHITFDIKEAGDLQHHRREYKDGELLFLANSSLEHSAKGCISLRGEGLQVLDTYTGKMYRHGEAKVENGVVHFEYDLDPAGHLLLFAPKCTEKLNTLPVWSVADSKTMKAVAPTSKMEIGRVGDNYLTLGFCDLKVDEEQHNDLFIADAATALYAHFGMKNPWERAIQFKDNIIKADTLKTGNITVKYEFNVGEKFDYSSMKLVCEKPALWEVRINGAEVTPIADEHPLDARNGCYSIGKHVRKGKNIVTLHRSPMSLFAEISYVFVSGNFSVVPDKLGWKIVSPRKMNYGSWHKNGAPFYSWDVAYKRTYNIENCKGRKLVKLGDWKGTVNEVWVNGVKAGAILTQPSELDVTDYLKQGENTIEVRCIGSLYNLYGPHFSKCIGMTGPSSWYVNAKPTTADKYVLMEYGLWDEFQLLSE